MQKISDRPAHIAVLRARIGDQRQAIAERFATLGYASHAEPQRQCRSVIGVGLVLLATATIASNRRLRRMMEATLSAGWLVWRATRLVQIVSTLPRGRPRRP